MAHPVKTVGSRREVWNGTALKTSYNKKALRKRDLMQNKHGRIISRRKYLAAKKNKHLAKKRDELRRKGFFKKGTFKLVPKARAGRR